MTKEEIVDQLNEISKQVIDLVSSLSNDEAMSSKNEKWNALQQVEHLIRSIQPLNKAMKIPLPGLKILFGTTNREERSFDETVLKYKNALKKGGKASGRYVPSHNQNKEKLIKKYRQQVDSLNKTIKRWKEEDLSKYILPHPLIGKLTIKEMLYFTIYHTAHHVRLIKENLDS